MTSLCLKQRLDELQALMAFENIYADVNVKYAPKKYKYVHWVLFKYDLQ